MESKSTDNGMIFEDENHFCRIDFSSALWAETNLTGIYDKAKLSNLLKSVDSIAEIRAITEDKDMLLLMEYKNFYDERADLSKLTDKQKRDTHLSDFAKKYYNSLHYAMAKRQNVNNRKIYVYILEAPNGDVFLREHMRERLKKKLPFLLQKQNNFNESLIDEVHIVDIKGWRKKFGHFPISIKRGDEFLEVEG